jgi:hypothetical protein
MAGTLTLCRTALRLPAGFMKKQAMADDLEYLGIPGPLAKELLQAVYGEG